MWFERNRKKWIKIRERKNNEMERIEDDGVERILEGDLERINNLMLKIESIEGMGMIGKVIGEKESGRDKVRIGLKMKGDGGSNGKMSIIKKIREGMKIKRKEIRSIRIGEIEWEGGMYKRKKMRMNWRKIEKMNGDNGV